MGSRSRSVQVHRSIRTRDQPWHQQQGQAQHQQISCRSSRSKGSRRSNDVQDRSSLHTPSRGRPWRQQQGQPRDQQTSCHSIQDRIRVHNIHTRDQLQPWHQQQGQAQRQQI